MTPSVSLQEVGLGNVTLSIVYPERLTPIDDESHPQVIAVMVRPDRGATVPALDITLELGDGAFFVDARGEHVPGHVAVPEGSRQGTPHDVGIAHANIRADGVHPAIRGVAVRTSVTGAQGGAEMAALGFEIGLVGAEQYAAQRAGRSLALAVTLVVACAASLASLAEMRERTRRRRSAAIAERQSALYGALKERLQGDDWAGARGSIEQIRAIGLCYRDVDDLDRMVSAAETSAWRREQLYAKGTKAYRDRQWAFAAEALRAIEAEAPHYGDVRFLRRTADLYVDLQSRDRSLRTTAARQLGEVGDLLDAAPLLDALGDPSEQVAEAAAGAFRVIGPGAIDTLVAGLAHNEPSVRERASRLIEEHGQAARAHLLGALKSADLRLGGPAARLLGQLGARQELADALLYATFELRGAIIGALVSEGPASCGALVQTLLSAAPERQQAVLDSIAALKAHHDLDRYLEDMLRRTKDPQQRDLLQRAIRMPVAYAEKSGQLDAGSPGTISSSALQIGAVIEQARGLERAARAR